MTAESSNTLKHTKSGTIKQAMINRFYSLVLDEILTVEPHSILDAGCGEGFFLERAKQVGVTDLYGFDRSGDALRMACDRTRLPRDRLWRFDLCDGLGTSRSFDVICCFEVLEHMDDPQIGLINICNHKSNYIFLSVPKEPFFCLGNLLVGKNITRLGNDMDHKQLWTERGFLRFVEHVVGGLYAVESFGPRIFLWTLVKCARLEALK